MTTSSTRPALPTSQGLHYSFEKAGLTLDRQPIPWNVEAVLVEAIVRIPSLGSDALRDFGLFLPGGGRVAAETSRPGDAGQTRVFFRLAVPPHTMPAEVRFRDRSLGQINLPLLTREEFLNGIKVAEPTVHVRLKDDAHACQAFVTTQAKEILASMLLSSPTSLAPLVDLELGANVVCDDVLIERRIVRLESNQLAGKQALVVVPFPKPRTGAGDWHICWTLGEQILATRGLRGYRAIDFQRSLRISTTRLFLEGSAGALPLVRLAPTSWEGIERVGPVFLVSSGIAGMAAQAEFRVRVLNRNRKVILEMPPISTLVSDGPTVIAPGTLGRDDAIVAFELWCGSRRLGELTLISTPKVSFTGEGGIAEPVDFAWSPQAEEELQQKLGLLLGGG